VKSFGDRHVRVNLDPSATYAGTADGYNQKSWKLRPGWAGMSLTINGGDRLPDSKGPYTFAASGTKVAVTTAAGKKVKGSPFSSEVVVKMSGTASPSLIQVMGRSGPQKNTTSSSGADVRYRGDMRIRSNGSRLRLVNRVGIEGYLYGVVPRESTSSWPQQELRAQAIAARSYAAASGTGDLYCDTRSQVYNGYSHGTRTTASAYRHEVASTNTAVDATKGRYVTYGGSIVKTFFSAASGGYSANNEDIWGGTAQPYYRGVPDPHETGSYDPWNKNVTVDGLELAKLIKSKVSGEPSGAGSTVYVQSVTIHHSWPTGFVRTVDVTWSTGAKSTGISASSFRSALSLRSTKFFVNANGGRLTASDRYLRSVAASKRAYATAGSATSVVVVNGDDAHYADAASAVALSSVADGPVLFVRAGSVSSAVLDEVKRLDPEKLYIVGDSNAVSSTVGVKLKALVPNTTRLGGSDRYKTSAAVAREAVKLGANPGRVIVSPGASWTDAAVAAAVAGAARRPLLLTAESALSSPTAAAIEDLGFTSSVVVGGTDVLSAQTIEQLCARTGEGAPAKRIGVTGDRYDTAVEAATWAVDSLGCTASTVYVATGKAIPDAFIAAGLSAHARHPLLLTSTYTPSDVTRDYLAATHDAISSVTIVGRPSTVGIACALQLQSDGH